MDTRPVNPHIMDTRPVNPHTMDTRPLYPHMMDTRPLYPHMIDTMGKGRGQKTRPGDLVGAGPNWVTFWSKFGLF